MLLAIDSGANCGWALFHSQRKILVACGLRTFGRMPCRPQELTRIVVERPHAGQTRARKRDILTLAIHAGEVGGVWSFLSGVPAEYLEPQRWKGQVPKSVMNERVIQRLGAAELAVIPKGRGGKLDHNILDAIGIGLHCVGRLP